MLIRRYFFAEIIKVMFVLLLMLLLIYISHRFMSYLVQAAAGSIAASYIFSLLGLRLLRDLTLLIPLGFFLAILIALGRLYKDNEITALAACGINVPYRSILGLGAGVACFIALLSMLFAPWADRQVEKLRIQAASEAEISAVAAGRFKEFMQGNGIFYVEDLNRDTKTLSFIFAQANLEHSKAIIIAQSGQQEQENGELFLNLKQGYRYHLPENSLEHTVIQFEEHRLHIPRKLDNEQTSRYSALPTGVLWSSNQTAYMAELQWRISLPLSVLLLTALAVPLSRTTPRQGQFAKLFAGILLFLIYNNLLNVAKKWLERGEIPPWVGLWWVHLLMLVVVFITLWLPTFSMQWQAWRQSRLAPTSP